MTDLSEMQVSRSITIDAPASTLYDAIADVTRIGEFSPVCTRAWWDEGSGPKLGGGFTGHNERDGREWEMHCEVTAAEPDKTFGWIVDGRTAWNYTFTEENGKTKVEESWALKALSERQAEMTDEEFAELKARTVAGIEETLATLKAKAEA